MRIIKSNISEQVAAIGMSLLFFLVCPPGVAQSGENPDTPIVLKYKLDSITTEENGQQTEEESRSDEEKSDTITDPEYFLRKEFTGQLFDSLLFRNLPDSILNKFREDDAFWYANEVFRKRPQPKNKNIWSFLSHPYFQTLLWIIIIGGFVTFLIMYLYNSNVGIFRKTSVISPEESNVGTEDIFSINYQIEIDRSVEAGNYRLAVRLMFLRLLKNLSDRNIIEYKPDNTNLDYLVQLRQRNMYADFFRLTRNYEYCWYGQFEIDKEKFEIVKKDFDSFERKLLI